MHAARVNVRSKLLGGADTARLKTQTGVCLGMARVGTDRRTWLGCGIPVAMGLAGIVHGVYHAATNPLPPIDEALVVLSPIVEAALLFAAAAWVVREHEPRHQLAIALWSLGGWLYVGAVIVIIFLGQTTSGGVVVAPWVTIHLTAVGGGLLGFFVGAHHIGHERARERAEELHGQLAVYLRLLRHDVRNDAQLIQGYADLMEREPDAEGLDEIRSAARHVIRLTQLSQAFDDDGEGLRVRELAPVLQDVVQTLEERFPDADLRLVEPVPEAHVRADDLLENVFENIARNAIQHSDDPAPRVRIHVTEDPGRVQIRVVDDGPGVPPEDQARLFSADLERSPGEGGIGLYLVSVIVDRYEGRVELEHTGSEGSTFLVELPTTDPEEPVPEAETA